MLASNAVAAKVVTKRCKIEQLQPVLVLTFWLLLLWAFEFDLVQTITSLGLDTTRCLEGCSGLLDEREGKRLGGTLIH